MSYVCPNVAIAMAATTTPTLATELARGAGHIVVGTVYAAAQLAVTVKEEFDKAVRRRNAQLAAATLLSMGYKFEEIDDGDAIFAKGYGTNESVVAVAMTDDGVRVYVDRQRGDMREEQIARCTRESFEIAQNLRGAQHLPTMDQAGHLLRSQGVLIARRRERLPMPVENPMEVCVVTGEVNAVPTRTLAEIFGVPVANSQQTLEELFDAAVVARPLPMFEMAVVR